MNERNTTRLLSDFYEGKRLSPERVTEIRHFVAQKNLGPDASSSRSRNVLRFAPWLSAAAAFLMTISAVFLYEHGERPLSTIFRTSTHRSVEAIQTDSLPAADIIVLSFSADWCSPSKVVSPMFAQLKRSFNADRVLFLDLNLTDAETAAQSKYLVSALGIENIWKKQGGITGELLYVNIATREIITTFNAENDYQQMNLALVDALADRGGNT